MLIIVAPNLFLLLIQPNPNGLRGAYFEIFTVAPSFVLYYCLVLAASLGLMALSVIKKSTLAGLTAYAVIAPSFFMPRLVNSDWLTFNDVLNHGRWLIASPVHFAQIYSYDQWPGAYALWLLVCRVLSLNVIQGSTVMLGADWCFRIVATLVLARLLIRQSGLGGHLSYVLAAFILVFFQNSEFSLSTYYDAALAQSFSILFIYLLLRARTSSAQVIVLATVWTAIVITHPLYTMILGLTAIFVVGYAVWSRGNHRRGNSNLLLVALVTISLLWNASYASQGLQESLLDFLSGFTPSLLWRPETLQVRLGLPFYGVVIDQAYKLLALPLVALLFVVYLFRGKMLRASKILILSYVISAASSFFVFLFIPYYETSRPVLFVLLGLTTLAGLQIANLASGSLRRKLIALALLVLLFPTPFFLTVQPPIYTRSITHSIETSVAFASNFPSPYFAVVPMNIYLRYSDPYLTSLREISPPYGTEMIVISPRVGLTLVLTFPPGQLTPNMFTGVTYTAAWNNSDKVYVSGGVEGYYSLS